MTSDRIAPPSPRLGVSSVGYPDPALEALPSVMALQALVPALHKVARQRHKRAAQQARWGEPSLFFFHPNPLPSAYHRRPEDAPPLDWSETELHHLLARLEPVLTQQIEVRRLLRAMPTLCAELTTLSQSLPELHRLTELVALLDDAVIVLLDPEREQGWRLRVSGLQTVDQFAGLLAARIPAYRPDRRGMPFQLYRSTVWQRNHSLPMGAEGAGHWLFGERFLAEVPEVAGERTILIGPRMAPVLSGTLTSATGVTPRLELLQTLPPHDLFKRLGLSIPSVSLRRVA